MQKPTFFFFKECDNLHCSPYLYEEQFFLSLIFEKKSFSLNTDDDFFNIKFELCHYSILQLR